LQHQIIHEMMSKTSNTIQKETLAELAKKLGVSEQDILSHCRRVDWVDARSMIVAILLNRPHVRQQDVAPLLGISQAAVSKLLARHRRLMEYNSFYRQAWKALQIESL